MSKQEYEKAYMDIIELNIPDVVTASGDDYIDPDTNQNGWVPKG